MAGRPPPPTANDQPDSVVLNKFSGLKNVVAAERLGPDELEFAVNVDIDDAGQIHRRRGRTKVSSGKFHSLFQDMDGVVFCVKNGNLGFVNPDYSFSPLDSGYPDDPVAYVQVGPIIYFSSRTRAGTLNRDNGYAVGPWGSTPDLWYSPVVNPTATLPDIAGRLLGPPPLATSLAYWNGRIYLGSGRQVWATELFLYNFVDKTKNFWTFEADVTMIGSVTDGLYIGTTEGVWFVSGAYGEAKRVRVMDSGVIPGSMVYVPSEVANPGLKDVAIGARQDTDAQVSILFMTTEGFCGGKNGGDCYNYTESKFVFPDMERAAGAYRKQDGMHQYLAFGNSGGTPSSNARIGDYVDAQLIRGGSWQTVGETVRFGDSASWRTP